MNLQTILISAVALVSLSNNAEGVEPLSTPELAQHCAYYHDDRDGKDAIFCIRHVQGFIDGAAVTDARVVEKIVDDLANRRVLDKDLLARDAVFSTLRREYPCDPEDDS